jgi:hypothetical protein
MDNKVLLVKAYMAWEKVKFAPGPEKDEYDRLSKLESQNDVVVSPSCNLDDEDCLSCGS